MRTFFAEARKAVFGETWVLPLAVGAELGIAAALHHLLPDQWSGIGGPALIVATGLILVVVAGSQRRA